MPRYEYPKELLVQPTSASQANETSLPDELIELIEIYLYPTSLSDLDLNWEEMQTLIHEVKSARRKPGQRQGESESAYIYGSSSAWGDEHYHETSRLEGDRRYPVTLNLPAASNPRPQSYDMKRGSRGKRLHEKRPYLYEQAPSSRSRSMAASKNSRSSVSFTPTVITQDMLDGETIWEGCSEEDLF